MVDAKGVDLVQVFASHKSNVGNLLAFNAIFIANLFIDMVL